MYRWIKTESRLNSIIIFIFIFLAHQHKACRQLKIKQEMTAAGD